VASLRRLAEGDTVTWFFLRSRPPRIKENALSYQLAAVVSRGG